MYQLDIGGFTVDVVRKDIKNIHLSVYPPEGRVRIAAPLDVEDENIRLFIISKISWIKKNQRKFQNQDRQSKRAFQERESHYFEGRRYLLNVIEHNAPAKVVIRNKIYMDLYVRPGATQEQCQKVLNEWYRRQLKNRIPEIMEKWEKIIGVNVLDWSVKLMKTKWGTCNIEKKSILINLELAKKPVSCLEYIIVHEMIHLLERHHNERFLYYMNQFLPRWKSLKEELNQFPISHGEWTY
jgi:predicted metal-dependent hydrolase